MIARPGSVGTGGLAATSVAVTSAMSVALTSATSVALTSATLVALKHQLHQ